MRKEKERVDLEHLTEFGAGQKPPLTPKERMLFRISNSPNRQIDFMEPFDYNMFLAFLRTWAPDSIERPAPLRGVNVFHSRKIHRFFDSMDTNSDKTVTRPEFDQWWEDNGLDNNELTESELEGTM